MHSTILLVEDDTTLGQAILDTVELSGYKLVIATSVTQAEQLLKQHDYIMVITDMNLGRGYDGLEVIKMVSLNYQIPTLVITAYGSIDNAVAAVKSGAVDYILKPFIPEKLIDLIQRYAKTNIDYIKPIAISPNMQKIVSMAERVAATSATVLLYGESGTGKEVFANYIHNKSDYAKGPFVAVNCAAIPENMLEAILFGYEKGSFTGAYKTTQGKFEQAQNGTLLLDEVSEMPMLLQSKILRVLQEKQVERLGGKQLIDLNVRIISATNKDLKRQIDNKEFREDLYYRISVFPIHIPPLRERVADIMTIAEHVISSLQQDELQLSEDAQDYLLRKKWLGNIRELENVLHRAAIVCNNNTITKQDLHLGDIDELVTTNQTNDLKRQEFIYILQLLNTNVGNRKATAESLGISERTLRNKLAKMRELGMEIPLAKRAIGE